MRVISSQRQCCNTRGLQLPLGPFVTRRITRNVSSRIASKGEVQKVEEQDATSQTSPAVTQARRRAVLSAQKAGVQGVQELQRTLAEYMSLPASQYSVLDARKIERISDDMFRCYVGELRMLQWSVEPVLTVSVTVEPEAGGCTIRLLSCELKGSKFVEDLNHKFGAQMTNVVRWRVAQTSADGHGSDDRREIVSTTTLRVELEIPAWCGFLSVSAVEGTGSGVLQNVLNAMVPRFLAQLKADYSKWASGDSSRTPAGEL